jgi:hypothetical protein
MTDEFGNSRDHADREIDRGPADDISSTITLFSGPPKRNGPSSGGQS